MEQVVVRDLLKALRRPTNRILPVALRPKSRQGRRSRTTGSVAVMHNPDVRFTIPERRFL
jgi:hypothetical protein